jgi:bifunctional DNA-binding transcriptional regulator/antitoxin component of YhaV-PrlF toxin-antitoxin module
VVKAMTSVDIELPTDGQVVVPRELSGAMGWDVGEKLTVQMKDGEIRIFSQAQAILRAQEWISGFVAEGRSLADELIAERKQESLSE